MLLGNLGSRTSGVALGVLAVASIFTVPRGHAQSALPTAPPTAPNPRAGNSTPLDANGTTIQRRLFAAGQRTYWHSHEKGFLIFVEKGRALVQRKGEPIRELKAGDADYTPPNVMHWHGAAPNEDFVQLGVLFGGGMQFADPVTDAEYDGKAKR